LVPEQLVVRVKIPEVGGGYERGLSGEHVPLFQMYLAVERSQIKKFLQRIFVGDGCPHWR
jgi:hypothetical protein